MTNQFFTIQEPDQQQAKQLTVADLRPGQWGVDLDNDLWLRLPDGRAALFASGGQCGFNSHADASPVRISRILPPGTRITFTVQGAE